MFSDIYEFLKNIEPIWIFLGFAGILLLANFFVLVFRIKGIKKEKNNFVKSFRRYVFVYSFFVVLSSLIKGQSNDVTLGCLALLICWDVVIHNVCDKFFSLSHALISKRDFFPKDVLKVENTPSEKIISSLKVAPIKEKNNETEENINVSHVKSIIKRLNCFSLNSAEKKQINDLDILLSQIENGKNDHKTKEMLNDGLNALLKIMAKYAV